MAGLGAVAATDIEHNSVEDNSKDTSAIISTNTSAAAAVSSAVATGVAAGGGQKVSVNVLNDIGNMLANLTDELDAMLEEEKRVGLNIDSE